MAKAKKTQLPKDFEAQLRAGDLDQLKAVFEACDVNAVGGYYKQTALAFVECPDELARWLVAHGADLSAPDGYGNTPLHSRAGHWQGRVDVLLELGADVNAGENGRATPLHEAARVGNVAAARLLLQHGARVDANDQRGQTPLMKLLTECSNASIERAAAMAQMLLDVGARKTDAMKAAVTRIGTDFEFHRENFNPESVDATSAALERLYVLFDVPPVPRRTRHDGKSPIVARGATWQEQHEELWNLLVPSSGAAATVQGEVVRIAGRIDDEMSRNGGINWDSDYKKMADAFLTHVASGVPLPPPLLAEARDLVAAVKKQRGDTLRLAELGVSWVKLNPTPMKLAAPKYRR